MLTCWLYGHKPLLLNVLNKKALISINESFIGVNNKMVETTLVKVHMCERCKYIYWEYPIWD